MPRKARTGSEGLLWVAPALVLICAFLVWPTLRTIWISFHTGSIIRPTREFVGLANFVRLLTSDSLFLNFSLPPWSALFNTGIWVVLFTSGVIGFGLIIAVFGDGTSRTFESTVKSFIFVPIIISFTAASVVFRLVFATNPGVGIVNATLSRMGFNTVAWLGNKNVVNFAVISAGVWVWTALSMTLLSAAYKGIPQDVREASAIDGANQWQTFWKVSVPMIAPVIGIVAVTMIINALKAVDLVLIMTQGGPGGVSRIVGFTVYWELFTNNKAGYGSAAAVVLLVLMIPLMIYQLRHSGLEGTLKAPTGRRRRAL